MKDYTNLFLEFLDDLTLMEVTGITMGITLILIGIIGSF